jgi:hypothetical protein
MVHHRERLLQLSNLCGFSANNIADILKGDETDLGQAILELSRSEVLLFGLIDQGLFTADQLAERLRGSGERVGEVFEKDPVIRAALHTLLFDKNAKRASPSTIPDDDWLKPSMFVGLNDLDMSLFDLDPDGQSRASQSAKRPRFA